MKKKNNGTESGFFYFVLRRTEMMKLFKKLLAVAMVAVLALTVLTGLRCR